MTIRAILVLAFFAVGTLPASGADIFVARDYDGGIPHIAISGEIRQGDVGRFITALQHDPGQFAAARAVRIASPGGDVPEAIELAKLIEKLRYAVHVEKGTTCASACFFVVAAASERYLEGEVIVHRVYLARGATDTKQLGTITDTSRRWMVAAKVFLEAYQVPTSIVEHMTLTPSTSGHVLTFEERKALSVYSPSWEEVLIARCSLSNADIFRPHSEEERSKMKVCAYEVGLNARFAEMLAWVDRGALAEALKRESESEG